MHVDGTDDLAQSNQHFIMFFHGVGGHRRAVERRKILRLIHNKVNMVFGVIISALMNFMLGYWTIAAFKPDI
ncbi:hypothetical protein D3C84_585770 [compost metagenome]